MDRSLLTNNKMNRSARTTMPTTITNLIVRYKYFLSNNMPPNQSFGSYSLTFFATDDRMNLYQRMDERDV